LVEELKRFATTALGLQLVGVASAEPLADDENRLQTWLAAGRHGGMGYLADTAAVRARPDRFLPGARSVICVAMSYHDEHEPPRLHPEVGSAVVARYARRTDYHRVIKRRLLSLGRWLARVQSGVRWRAAVDTAPLLEKALAQRAGLGWIGRHTCLVHPELGSELLLGELVTTLELPPDAPQPDRCGTCRACVDSCPTRALDGAPGLHAGRCIAYLTIEHDGEFPTAPPLHGYLFGCDICQAVCPFNRAAPSCAVALRPRPELAAPARAQLAALDEASWRALVAGTPLTRLGFARLRRNLAALATS
jgi:epoxyqueuosine reductase